jgi:hypothetical protein
MGRNGLPHSRGRDAAGVDNRLPVDQHEPQDRDWEDPKQAAPSGTRRNGISGKSGASHQRFLVPYVAGQIPSKMMTMPAIAAVKASERTSGMPKA